MSGTSIRFIPDNRALLKELSKVGSKLKSLKPVMKDFGEYMLRETEQHFKDEKSPFGKKWKKLSKSTLKYKKGRKILTESTILRGSIVYKASSDGLKVGTVVKYARIHQLGGNAGRGRKTKIPARPFLGYNKKDEKEFYTLAREYLFK